MKFFGPNGFKFVVPLSEKKHYLTPFTSFPQALNNALNTIWLPVLSFSCAVIAAMAAMVFSLASIALTISLASSYLLRPLLKPLGLSFFGDNEQYDKQFSKNRQNLQKLGTLALICLSFSAATALAAPLYVLASAIALITRTAKTLSPPQPDSQSSCSLS